MGAVFNNLQPVVKMNTTTAPNIQKYADGHYAAFKISLHVVGAVFDNLQPVVKMTAPNIGKYADGHHATFRTSSHI